MNYPIEAKFKNTLEHFMEANLWHGRYQQGRGRRIFAWSCMGVLFVMGVLALCFVTELRLVSIWAVVFPVIMVVSAFIVRPCRLRKVFNELPVKDGEVTWRFHDKTVEVNSDQGSASFSWDAIVRAGVTVRGASLFPQKNISHWVPASAFASPEDFERFVTLVKSRVSKTRTMR